jgi:ComF family protein
MDPAAALADGILSLVYPPCCLACRTPQPANGLCDRCRDAIRPVPEPICARCGQALLTESSCSHCRARTPAFDCARAMGAYEGTLRHAIHRLKYRDRPQLADPLGELLADYAREHSRELHGLRFDSVAPVPMHPVRQRLRGYNQSERLARSVTRALELPLSTGVLIRNRATRPQVGLEGAARRTNIAGAFAVKEPNAFAGQAVLLIDDVATTGTTLHEAASALKEAGATAVYCLTLAAG